MIDKQTNIAARLVWTACPEDYDYPTVVDSTPFGRDRDGRLFRRVTLVESDYRIQYQINRYLSGWYATWTDAEEVDRQVEHGYITPLQPCRHCGSLDAYKVRVSGLYEGLCDDCAQHEIRQAE